MQHFCICFSAYFFMLYSIFSGLSLWRGKPPRGREDRDWLASFGVCLSRTRKIVPNFNFFQTNAFFQLPAQLRPPLPLLALTSPSPRPHFALTSPSPRPHFALSPPHPHPLSARKKAALLPPFLISQGSPPPVLIWSACW